MRELTKSIGSFSWAMSLFSVRQAFNFVRRPIPDGGHPSTRDLDTVARAAGGELGSYLGRVFEAGDRLQRSMTDLTFDLLTLDFGGATRRSGDVLRRSTEVATRAIPGTGGDGPGAPPGARAPGGPAPGQAAPGGSTAPGAPPGAGAAGQPPEGWGPMPPVD